MYRPIAILTATLVAASPAIAAQPKPLPPGVAGLLDCRAITDDAQRLACFDRQSKAFADSVTKRDVVLIDRNEAKATRRSLFGFSLPDFGGLLGGGDEEDIKEINSQLRSSSYGQGGLVVQLEDGSSWAQTDDARLGRIPGPGAAVRIRKGSFGSYMMKVGNLPAIRAKRIG